MRDARDSARAGGEEPQGVGQFEYAVRNGTGCQEGDGLAVLQRQLTDGEEDVHAGAGPEGDLAEVDRDSAVGAAQCAGERGFEGLLAAVVDLAAQCHDGLIGVRIAVDPHEARRIGRVAD